MAATNLAFVSFDFDDVRKLTGDVFRNSLKSRGMAVAVVRRGTIHRLGYLSQSTHGRAKGVGEAHVIAARVRGLQRLGISFREGIKRKVRRITSPS